MSDIKLPSPTGAYKVGTTTFSVTDENRIELLGDNAGKAKRRLFARLYYPVKPEDTEGLEQAEVMSEVKLKALAKTFHMPIKSDAKIDSNCFEDAKPAGRFPLLIFSHGMGSYAESNHQMCIDLCSNGYNVLAVGHAFESVANEYDDGTVDFMDKTITKRVYDPYWRGTFALLKTMGDKKSSNEEAYAKFMDFQDKYARFIVERMEERVKDIKFIIDEAVRRYGDLIDDPENIGVFGHSIGGATAYYLCMTDARFKAGMNLDGMLVGHYNGMVMRTPFCQISCDDAITTETKIAINMEAPYYWEIFKGMRHQGFSDLKFFIPVKAVTGKMPAEMMHENLCKIGKSFFDKYIKGLEIEVFEPDNDWIQRRR